MYGFKLTANGDVSINDGQIETVDGVDLEGQTIKTVIGTNKGEWPFNLNEGVDFRQILGKGVTEDMARSQITSGVHQVNGNRNIENFNYTVDQRSAVIDFTAREQDGSNIALTAEY